MAATRREHLDLPVNELWDEEIHVSPLPPSATALLLCDLRVACFVAGFTAQGHQGARPR